MSSCINLPLSRLPRRGVHLWMSSRMDVKPAGVDPAGQMLVRQCPPGRARSPSSDRLLGEPVPLPVFTHALLVGFAQLEPDVVASVVRHRLPSFLLLHPV